MQITERLPLKDYLLDDAREESFLVSGLILPKPAKLFCCPRCRRVWPLPPKDTSIDCSCGLEIIADNHPMYLGQFMGDFVPTDLIITGEVELDKFGAVRKW